MGNYPATLVKTCSCGWTTRMTAKTDADLIDVVRKVGALQRAHLMGRSFEEALLLA